MNQTKPKTKFQNNTKIPGRRIFLGITAVFMSSALLSHGQNPSLSLTPEVTQARLNAASELLVTETKSLTNNTVKLTSLSLSSHVRQTILENGLTILTKEVPTAPVVSVQVWYRVGFLDETPEQKQVAHLLEHMLFRGTKKRPIQFGQLFTALDSDFDAFIGQEYTHYIHTIAPHKLKALLILEADRMQNTLIKADDLAQEKQILLTELQGRENDPYYRLYCALLKAQFPHLLYSQRVTKADLDKITVEQVHKFYRQYYRPNNASLVIVGNFQTEELLQDIKAIFGGMTQQEEITRTQKVKPKRLPISRYSTSRLPIVRRGAAGLPAMAFMYPLPERNHPDIPALMVMDYILNYGASSYLSRALGGSGIANSAIAQPTLLSEEGWYFIGVTANLKRDLNRVQGLVEQVIKHLQTQGVSPQQLDRAKAQIRGNTVLRHRTVANQAHRIGYDLTVSGNYRYTDGLLEAVNRVSTKDVQRVAQKYLSSQKRTIGRLEPTQPKKIASDIQTIHGNVSEDFSPTEPFATAEIAKYLPPFPAENRQQRAIPVPQKFILPNGLQVLLFPDSTTPSVSLRAYVRAGQEFEPPDKAGLAALTVTNLFSGPFWLVQELENRGGLGITFQCHAEGVNIYGVSLADDLPLLLEALADRLQYASFPTQPLEISRQNYLKFVQVAAEEPANIARQTLVEAFYPADHPLSQVPNEVTLKAISREDIVKFYQQHYRPDNIVFALVGDFNVSQVRAYMETIFGNWQASGKPPISPRWSEASIPKKMMRLHKSLSRQTQSLTLMGYPIPELAPKRFYAAKVLNEILGGNSITSRLGNELRYHRGLTYTINSRLDTGIHSSLFYIFMETTPKNSTAAISSTLAVLRQLNKEGVSNAEVEIAKQRLISQYRLALAAPDDLTSIILFNHIYGYSPQEISLVLEQIQAVTTQQVNQVAKELLKPDRMAIITVDGGS